MIAGAVLAANGPDAIRIGVMLPRAAAYDFALAVIGMRMAAKIAESTLPKCARQRCGRQRDRSLGHTMGILCAPNSCD